MYASVYVVCWKVSLTDISHNLSLIFVVIRRSCRTRSDDRAPASGERFTRTTRDVTTLQGRCGNGSMLWFDQYKATGWRNTYLMGTDRQTDRRRDAQVTWGDTRSSVRPHVDSTGRRGRRRFDIGFLTLLPLASVDNCNSAIKGATENAGVENVALDDRGGKCGSKWQRSVIVS